MGRKKYDNPKETRTKKHANQEANTRSYIEERVAWAVWQVTRKPNKDFPDDVNKRALGLMPQDSPQQEYFEHFIQNPEEDLRRNAKGEREAEGYVLFFENKSDAESQAERLERVMKKCGLLGRVHASVTKVGKEDRAEYQLEPEWKFKLRITAVKKEDLSGLNRHEESLYLRALRAEEELGEYQ